MSSANFLHFRKKSQSATEYLVVVSVALALLSPLIVMAQQTVYDLNTSINLIEANNALTKIKNAADRVYAQGYPSKLSFMVIVPNRMERMFVDDHALIMELSYKDAPSHVVEFFDYDIVLSGTPEKGLNRVTVMAYQNYVNITLE